MSVSGPSARALWERASISRALTRSRVVGESIAVPNSHSAVEAGVSSESVPSATGIEGDSVNEPFPKEILGKFAEDWLEILDKYLYLCYHFVDMFTFTETKAAEDTAAMVTKSERTVRRWQSGLNDNNGIFTESRQGRYQQSGVYTSNWKNEELNKKAVEYVQENTVVKGRPNLTRVHLNR